MSLYNVIFSPHACIQLKTWQMVLLLFIECSFKIFCGAAYDVTGLMFLSFHMPNLAKVSIKPFFFLFFLFKPRFLSYSFFSFFYRLHLLRFIFAKRVLCKGFLHMFFFSHLTPSCSQKIILFSLFSPLYELSQQVNITCKLQLCFEK